MGGAPACCVAVPPVGVSHGITAQLQKEESPGEPEMDMANLFKHFFREFSISSPFLFLSSPGSGITLWSGISFPAVFVVCLVEGLVGLFSTHLGGNLSGSFSSPLCTVFLFSEHCVGVQE